MSDTAYFRPDSLEDALAILGQHPCQILSGGTDHFPARVGPQAPTPILDIGAIDALRGIRDAGDYLHLGARTTWTDVLEAELPPRFDGLLDGLKLAAREVGGVQIQNRGTLAGNICDASPAADGVPCLLAADAQVVIAHREGQRCVPLADFLTGYRQSVLRADEIVCALRLPKPSAPARSHFLKLGARHYLVISIAMVAVTLEGGADGTVTAARLAVGACSAVAQRLPELEARLVGQPMTADLGAMVQPSDLADLSPIDDARANADYRRRAAGVLLRRALNHLADDPKLMTDQGVSAA
jgi:CO/xanthine dehydrogenase FAD-binding subunit